MGNDGPGCHPEVIGLRDDDLRHEMKRRLKEQPTLTFPDLMRGAFEGLRRMKRILKELEIK